MVLPQYMLMLTGVGPLRAFHDRVSHVVAVFKTNDTTLTTLPIPDTFAKELSRRGVRHTERTVTVQGASPFLHVCTFVPNLPRNYMASECKGPAWGLWAASDDDAFSEVAVLLETWQAKEVVRPW